MLYSESDEQYNEFFKSIDCTIDNVVNNKVQKDIAKSIGKNMYLKEFNTVLFTLPRRSGKTTYLEKLCDKLKREGYNVALFSKYNYSYKTKKHNDKPYFDYILLDEFHKKDVDELLTDIDILSRLHENSFIIGLAT